MKFTVYQEEKKICSFTLPVTDELTKRQLEQEVNDQVKKAKSELKDKTIGIWKINGNKGDKDDSNVGVVNILGAEKQAEIEILVD